MEKDTKKRGIKPGTQFSDAHKKALSEAHKKLTGEKCASYKKDRTQMKVGAMSFTVTADVKSWLDLQPNKSKYILSLIRQDMQKHSNEK